MRGQLRIDTVWAFIVVDDDGTEGIPAFIKTGVVVPLIGADDTRLVELRSFATKMATNLGKRIELVRFSERESVEWIEP